MCKLSRILSEFTVVCEMYYDDNFVKPADHQSHLKLALSSKENFIKKIEKLGWVYSNAWICPACHEALISKQRKQYMSFPSVTFHSIETIMKNKNLSFDDISQDYKVPANKLISWIELSKKNDEVTLSFDDSMLIGSLAQSLFIGKYVPVTLSKGIKRK